MIAESIVQTVVCLALRLYSFVLLAYVVLSFVFALGIARRPYSGAGRVIVDALDALVLPVIRPLGRLVPPVRMGMIGLDLSVLIAFVILYVLQIAVCR